MGYLPTKWFVELTDILSLSNLMKSVLIMLIFCTLIVSEFGHSKLDWNRGACLYLCHVNGTIIVSQLRIVLSIGYTDWFDVAIANVEHLLE